MPQLLTLWRTATAGYAEMTAPRPDSSSTLISAQQNHRLLDTPRRQGCRARRSALGTVDTIDGSSPFTLRHGRQQRLADRCSILRVGTTNCLSFSRTPTALPDARPVALYGHTDPAPAIRSRLRRGGRPAGASDRSASSRQAKTPTYRLLPAHEHRTILSSAATV